MVIRCNSKENDSCFFSFLFFLLFPAELLLCNSNSCQDVYVGSVCLMQNNDLRKQLASLRHELQEAIQMRETAVADQTKAQQALQQQVELAAEVWILLGITDCFNGALLTALEQTYCTSQVFCWGMLGYFRVSIIHQTVTQTTWSLTWVCDHFAWGTLVYSLIQKTCSRVCTEFDSGETAYYTRLSSSWCILFIFRMGRREFF